MSENIALSGDHEWTREIRHMIRLPKLGAALPRRGGAVTSSIGKLILMVCGWTLEGEMPNLPKVVLIVAPHTSIWDFFISMAVAFALTLKISFLAKESLFRGPLGIAMRWLGGIPVDRSTRHNLVARTVDRFRQSDRLVLAILPEGTRGAAERWKSGFYFVALGADVPVVPVALDFKRKCVSFGVSFAPSGNFKVDLRQLSKHFDGVEGKRRRPESSEQPT